MKKQKTNPASKNIAAVPVSHPPIQLLTLKANLAGHMKVMSATPLAEVIKEFLLTKSPTCRISTTNSYLYVLKKLLITVGNIPIGNISASHVQQVALNTALRPRAQKHMLAVIRIFLDWSRRKGYLPAHLPTAAAHLSVQVPSAPTSILSVDQLRTLLMGTTDVNLLLGIALSAFTGIRSGDLERLTWADVDPGLTIHLPPELSMTMNRRSCRISVVMDEWLRPFYGCDGLILAKPFRFQIPRLARKLGIPWSPNILRRTCLAYAAQREVECQATQKLWSHHTDITTPRMWYPPTNLAALQYFATTPEAVGIKNWPEIVAAHLQRRAANCPAKSRKSHPGESKRSRKNSN